MLSRLLSSELVPLELLKSLLVITKTKSYVAAAQELGLSQPAISVHVKRLQYLLGGELFSRAGGETRLTSRGEIALRYAQRILDLNAEMLAVCGGRQHLHAARIGIPTAYADVAWPKLMSAFEKEIRGGASFVFAASAELLHEVESSFIDVAFVVSATPIKEPAESWTEPCSWIGARNFSLSPGTAIPLLSRPNSLSDSIAAQALVKAGLTFRRVLMTADMSTIIAAARAGLGVTAMVDRLIPADLRLTSRHWLPALPNAQAGILLRRGAEENGKIIEVQKLLAQVLVQIPDGQGLIAGERLC